MAGNESAFEYAIAAAKHEPYRDVTLTLVGAGPIWPAMRDRTAIIVLAKRRCRRCRDTARARMCV
jgi:hypothetical protein